MTGLDIRPGQKYVRLKTDGTRRVIEVDGVSGRYVQAIGWIEDRTDTGWVVRPKTRRRSRILLGSTFRAVYRRLREAS